MSEHQTTPAMTREQRLEAALRVIIEDAPETEPQPSLRSANAYEIEDAGYDRARWEMAEIAREALEYE